MSFLGSILSVVVVDSWMFALVYSSIYKKTFCVTCSSLVVTDALSITERAFFCGRLSCSCVLLVVFSMSRCPGATVYHLSLGLRPRSGFLL